MDDFQSVSLPPFLSKTYEMVDDLSTDSIVSWSGTNKSFIVWNPPEFARDLLPKYFKHNNFSSFIRQLNTYGFRKIDPEQWEFANDDFVRGQPHLMRNIHRRKPVHSHSMVQGQGNSSLSELERQEMKDKIERLQHEKEVLNVELHRHEQERQGMELQMKFLKDRLQHMQRQQHTMASFLARILQKPELASNPVPPQFELHERKRRLPRSASYDETSRIGSWESVARGNMETGKLMQLETFLTFWEDTICDDDIVDHNQLHVSSNLELHEPTSCSESQTASCTQLSTVENHSRSPAIDPNSGPAAAVSATPSETIVSESTTSIAAEIDATKKQPSKEQTARTSAANTNDGFWEQFLTENPGSLQSRSTVGKKEF